MNDITKLPQAIHNGCHQSHMRAHVHVCFLSHDILYQTVALLTNMQSLDETPNILSNSILSVVSAIAV